MNEKMWPDSEYQAVVAKLVRERAVVHAFANGMLVRRPDGSLVASRGTLLDLGFTPEQVAKLIEGGRE